MSYCFRYRVKMLTGPDVDGGSSSIWLELPEPTAATVTVADAYPAGKWVVFEACGFETEEAARLVGERLGDTLLIVGAVNRLGIDIGSGRTGLSFSKAAHEAVRRISGRGLRGETHGLMTYEEGTVQICNVDARGHVSINEDIFQIYLGNWTDASVKLTERQRNCAQILNDSFYANHPASAFILRISAVEALCDHIPISTAHREAIDKVKDYVATLALDDDIRQVFGRLLEDARRGSVRQAYMSKFRAYRTEAEAKAFDQLYGKRSTLLHDGKGSADLSSASSEALQLAVDLLVSELRSTQQDSTSDNRKG